MSDIKKPTRNVSGVGAITPLYQSELEQLRQESQKVLQELEKSMHKVSVYGYNLERSFTENCKEISGKGLTAEEARIKWGLYETTT